MDNSNSIGPVFEGAFPIGDTDVLALPIKDIGPAIGYYTCVLGFTVTERRANGATLQRDNATIGLEKNDADPEQTSVYFEVQNLGGLHQELKAKGIEPTPIGPSEHSGKKYRVFFAKEPYGVCFCFGQTV